MKITTTTQEVLEWQFENSGTFKVELENKVITSLTFCANGNDQSQCITSTDTEYLKNVQKALNGLFTYLEKDLGVVKP